MESHNRQAWVTALALAGLTVAAWSLRAALAVEGALDVDAINLGLGAFRFAPLEWQPHPPGYPGYVLLLKAIHLVAPGLDPLQVARAGSLLCGAATVPAVFWTARVLARNRQGLAPLAAAGLAAVNPVLWYSGADGQSHAAEGLATVLLFGLVALAQRRRGWPLLLLCSGAYFLAGSVRPNIVPLCAPMLVWLLWRRPWSQRLAALAVGGVVTAAWVAPLVHASGGWELYLRASSALYGQFAASYSVWGQRFSLEYFAVNANRLVWGVLFAAPPLAAWAGGARAPWRTPWALVLGAQVLFYLVVYIAEPGYLAGVAGLCCLAPAAWSGQRRRLPAVRAAVVAAGCAGFVLLGPAEVPRVGLPGQEPAPTLRQVSLIGAAHRAYRRLVRQAAAGRSALLVSDNMVLTYSRGLPLVLPEVQVGVVLSRSRLNPGLDGWLLFSEAGLDTLPTSLPLEPGPATVGKLRGPVELVVVGPGASAALQAAVRAEARCGPEVRSGRPGLLDTYPARCLPLLRLGGNTLHVSAVRHAPKKAPPHGGSEPRPATK